MEDKHTEILDSDLIQQKNFRRRKLLPWWMKIFTWIFLVLGIIAPIGLIFGLFGFTFQLSLYGLETYSPISVLGIGLIGIFLFKGILALGLWTEKDWAILLGQIDAILGIVICVFVMVIYPFFDNQPEFNFNFRLELLLLIPFLLKLNKIKNEWQQIVVANNV